MLQRVLVRNGIWASGLALGMAVACDDSGDRRDPVNTGARAGSAGSDAPAEAGSGGESDGSGGDSARAGGGAGGDVALVGGEAGQSGGEAGQSGGHAGQIGGEGGAIGGEGGQLGGEGGQVGGEGGQTAGSGGLAAAGGSSGSSGTTGAGATGGTGASAGTGGTAGLDAGGTGGLDAGGSAGLGGSAGTDAGNGGTAGSAGSETSGAGGSAGTDAGSGGSAGTSAEPVCGNDAVEDGEECDDGGTVLDAACDADCHYTCGNGVLDAAVGEFCDTAIASGIGACPVSCDDTDPCTTDALVGSACQAECSHGSVGAVDGDNCCLPGYNANEDDDCIVECGNNAVEPGEECDDGDKDADASCDGNCHYTCGNGVVDDGFGELCDTGIASGNGACPVSCDDADPCTTDSVVGSACQAECAHGSVGAVDNDTCCLPDSNANEDNDCPIECGNGAVEAGEACDDGNDDDTDDCTHLCELAPRAYRFNDLDLRDAHTWVNFLGCRDATDTPLAGFSTNGSLQSSVQTDANADSFLDFSPTLLFRDLDQAAATQPLELFYAACSAPLAGTTCRRGVSSPISVTATNMSAGQCSTFLAGTVRPYTPAITSTSGPCFVTDAITLPINILGVPLTLTDARISATYVGDPATSLTNGLLMGFLSEADANSSILPSTLPLIGGRAISSLLPGGTGNCNATSDKDVNNGVTGWWLYFNFPATHVRWNDGT